MTCPQDRPAVCGDTACTHDESCRSCDSDCPWTEACAYNDDGVCEVETAGESCNDCPGDRGACREDSACGNGVCEPLVESAASCAIDCAP